MRGTEGGWAGDRGEGLAPIICASLWRGLWDNDVCSSCSCSVVATLPCFCHEDYGCVCGCNERNSGDLLSSRESVH